MAWKTRHKDNTRQHLLYWQRQGFDKCRETRAKFLLKEVLGEHRQFLALYYHSLAQLSTFQGNKGMNPYTRIEKKCDFQATRMVA